MVVFHRRLPGFEYLAPRNLDETLKYLSSYGGQAAIMAGGTDLIPKIKSRKIKAPNYVIDIKNLPGLDVIQYDDMNGLTIGALATVRDIEKSPLIQQKYSLLFEAAASMASVQVRNRGTLAGNICNAVPSADTAPALLDLEARLKLVSSRGFRIVDINNFFTGPNQTAVADDEILTEIHLPVPQTGCRGRYLKLSPRASMDLAVVGVAVLAVTDSILFKDIRIALGAVAPVPLRAKQAEGLIRGQKISPELIIAAAETAAKEAQPIDDHRASAEYRRDMVRALTARALKQVCAKN
jgi:aerobic carbon-monoxide dehydrogenase medium subunit